MRVRLTLLDGGDGCSEVYHSESAARARLDELKHRAVDVIGAVQIESAGKPRTQKEVLDRYPCLVGHMICESLGYFTPNAAAGALLAYIEDRPFACEFYTHMAGGFREARLVEVGKQVIERAFRCRRRHRGYMAHYPTAKALVNHVKGDGEGPILASWF